MTKSNQPQPHHRNKRSHSRPSFSIGSKKKEKKIKILTNETNEPIAMVNCHTSRQNNNLIEMNQKPIELVSDVNSIK